MFDRIFDFFLSEPQRLIALGRALFRTGSLVVVIGLIGHVATTATEAIHRLGSPAVVPPQSLAELYPSLWTWWVPESIVGALPALCLMGLGLWLVAFGRRINRLYH